MIRKYWILYYSSTATATNSMMPFQLAWDITDISITLSNKSSRSPVMIYELPVTHLSAENRLNDWASVWKQGHGGRAVMTSSEVSVDMALVSLSLSIKINHLNDSIVGIYCTGYRIMREIVLFYKINEYAKRMRVLGCCWKLGVILRDVGWGLGVAQQTRLVDDMARPSNT